MLSSIIIVALLCGYSFISSHKPSRFIQSRQVGWNAYFNVALLGAKFLISGFMIMFCLWLVSAAVMFIFNIPYHLGWMKSSFTFAYQFLELKFLGLNVFIIMVFAFTIFISFIESVNARKEWNLAETREKSLQEIAKYSQIDALIIDSFKSNLPVLVTLKSRKVYVGLVHAARYDSLEDNAITIIPILSGYREKDTLSFIEQHNYSEYYYKNNITFKSSPLSIDHFRSVLIINEIESISMFDINTYHKFKSMGV